MRTKLHLIFILAGIILSITSCKDDHQDVFIIPEPDIRIVLLTDLGEGTEVVIKYKGAILEQYPEAEIIYIPSPAFEIKEAAFLLDVAANNYPQNTIFLGLVEPGLNNPRMVFKAQENKRFIVPDNGIATYTFNTYGNPDCYKIENPFPGGGIPAEMNYVDIYIEATLGLIRGRELSAFGNIINDPQTFPVQEATLNNGIINAQVIFKDNFGNCITNIPGNLLNGYHEGDLVRVSFAGGSYFASMGSYYSSVPVGQNVLFVNDMNRLEMAVNYGNLSERYGLVAGSVIEIKIDSARIGILQFNELTDPLAGIMIDRINEWGIAAHFITRNANGDFDALPGLVEELLAEGIDIIVPFSTPAAQASVLNTPEDIPVLFSVVTDPASAGLYEYRGNVCGLSDAPDYDQFLGFVREIMPEMNKAGTIYNNLESNSLFSQERLNYFAPLHQLELISATVSGVDDIETAYNQIHDSGIGAVLISGDNTMTAGAGTLVNIAMNDMLPVFGTDVANAEVGALATLSVDYELISRGTADLVIAVIRGFDPDDILTVHFGTDIIAVNTVTAIALGIEIPANILDNADYIFP